MSDGKRTYLIQIDGIDKSIDAVESLNKQLKTLEERINSLSSKAVNVSASGGGSSKKELDAEEKLRKRIINQEDKIIAARKEEYQILLQQKKEFKEIDNLQKDLMAQQRLQADQYANTMNGMKQKLADIKISMGNLDIGGDAFKDYQKQANEITNKLKEIEAGYGQYGRNVGNYANGVVDGFNKIKVAVGGSTKEYDNYRQAVKDLTQERFRLSQTLGQESEEYKNIDRALKTLQSDYADLNKSSKVMDNLMDTMQSLTSIASLGTGLGMLFNFDDKDYQQAMQKFAALTLILNGINSLYLQIQTNEGLFAKGWNAIAGIWENVGDRIGKASENATKKIGKMLLQMSSVGKYIKGYKDSADQMYDIGDRRRNGYIVHHTDISDPILGSFDVKGIGMTREEMMKLEQTVTKVSHRISVLSKGIGGFIKGISKFASAAIGAIAGVVGMILLPEAINAVTNFVKDIIEGFKTAKGEADRATEALKAYNRQLEIRRDLLSASYLKGQISDEKYLADLYKLQTENLIKQNDALNARAKAMENRASGWGRLWNAFDATRNVEYTGQRMTGSTTVGHGRLNSFLTNGNDLSLTVKDIKELETAWKQCNQAISENKDWFSKWQGGLKGWWNSIFATVKDTQEVARGLGNVAFGDFIARFNEANKKLKSGKYSAKEYAEEIKKLRAEMNNSEILNSVIANLDKYIPDEEVRNAVQNIINEITRLDDAFNMTSEGQIHYWNNVRIEAMKDGLQKELAQIKENERHEIATTALTEEQINLLHKKYQRQRQNAQDKANKESLQKAKEHGKKLREAENELISLRIDNMKDGLDKQLAQIENERRLAIQKANETGIKSGDIIIEINRKFDKKILDEKRRWAFEVMRVYEDLMARIEQANRQTFGIEAETASANVARREGQNIRNTGYEAITPSNYDNTKDLEAYYSKVYEIQKKALDTQTQIEQDRLERELDFAKEEERIRHERLIDLNGGEYIQQLRAGVISQEKYDELMERELNAHNARMNALQKEYDSKSADATENNLKNQQRLYAEYFDRIVDGVMNDKDKIDRALSKAPVMDRTFNIVNLTKTRQNINAALKQYEELKNGIIQKQKELDTALKEHKISPEDFMVEKKALDDELDGINESVKSAIEMQKEAVVSFIQGIDQYIQMLGQNFNQFMSALDSIAEAHYEKEMEAIEKQTDLLEQQLEKQREITQRYADDVNSIEDELETARGDRRQHLIDQLNAQMQAQRESLAQEKQIEKEQERLNKRKEKLEEEERKRKKEAAVRQAVMNAILAVSAAAVNTYPIPAIPMITMATAIGAAQVAAAKAAKYADGGVLKGKSHAQGGIKTVVGGRLIELEGEEYVTNKRTTAKNVDLLDFINSKKRRINLDDMIDFYSDKPRKSISNISKRYFADGGYIPTLRNDIDINDRVVTMMEQYASKPTVVQVVDILNKAESVRNTQVLAGLTPNATF